MGRFFFLLLGFVIGGSAIYTAFKYHVVKADSGIELIPKGTPSLADTYVDIRNYTVSDWAAHPTLSADIVAAEKTKLMGGSAANSAANTVQDEVQNLLNEIRR